MKLDLRVLLIFALLGAPHMAEACTVCMGDPNSNTAQAANAAIFLMLGVLGGMFSLLGAFAYSLYRRSKAPAPAHSEFGNDQNLADSLS